MSGNSFLGTKKRISMLKSFYPGGTGKKEPIRKKIFRILGWTLFVGALAALTAALGIFSGGIAVPVGASIIKMLLVEFGLGCLEGLIVAMTAEVIGKKNADNWLEQEIKNENPKYKGRVNQKESINNNDILDQINRESKKES